MAKLFCGFSFWLPIFWSIWDLLFGCHHSLRLIKCCLFDPIWCSWQLVALRRPLHAWLCLLETPATFVLRKLLLLQLVRHQRNLWSGIQSLPWGSNPGLKLFKPQHGNFRIEVLKLQQPLGKEVYQLVQRTNKTSEVKFHTNCPQRKSFMAYLDELGGLLIEDAIRS